MSYKDILVQTEATGSASRCEIAAALAARGGGQLTGLYLNTPLVSQMVSAEAIRALAPGDLAELILERIRCDSVDATKAAEMLCEIAAASKVACTCRVIGGESAYALAYEARHADLVVLGPLTPFVRRGVHASPIEIALGSGSPILVVPADVATVDLGARVLIAWNGSREAARALRDALPLLLKDCVIEIRIARPKHDLSEADSLRRHLRLYGHEANIEVVDDHGQSISQWLVTEAHRTDCDLMVMGLDAHKHFQEFELGRVSRELLYAPPLPMLISS
jgi:nucleotide-binding universal stress UspA family protein